MIAQSFQAKAALSIRTYEGKQSDRADGRHRQHDRAIILKPPLHRHSRQRPRMTLRTLRNATAPTLKDLARIAGVSPITASRALHPPELVAEATRLPVAQAVEQSGYVPNSLAGGLTPRQTRRGRAS